MAEPVDLTLPPYDGLMDLHGDVGGVPMSFAGNQWFLVDNLVSLLSERGVNAYIETIPPGLVRLRALGSPLRVGTLTISVRPRLVSLPPSMLEGLKIEDRYDYVEDTVVVAFRRGNAVRLESWCELVDLSSRLPIAIPNPVTEGIGAQLKGVISESCGNYETLASRSMITRVHHREIPTSLLGGSIYAGVMWVSEAKYWGLDYVEPRPTIVGRLSLALLSPSDNASRQAFGAFKSLSPKLKELYESYGFRWIGT